MEEHPVKAVLLQFGEAACDAAEELANSRSLTLDQAYSMMTAAALMLVNGTLYNGMNDISGKKAGSEQAGE